MMTVMTKEDGTTEDILLNMVITGIMPTKIIIVTTGIMIFMLQDMDLLLT